VRRFLWALLLILWVVGDAGYVWAVPQGPVEGPPRPMVTRAQVLTSAIGVLGAGFCFQSYEAISATGQALALRQRAQPAVAKRLEGIAATIAMSARSLKHVATIGLQGEDKLALIQMQAALGPLRNAALRLASYARTPTKKYFVAFENERQLAWRKLSSLFRK
jgi:hypothetical protein